MVVHRRALKVLNFELSRLLRRNRLASHSQRLLSPRCPVCFLDLPQRLLLKTKIGCNRGLLGRQRFLGRPLCFLHFKLRPVAAPGRERRARFLLVITLGHHGFTMGIDVRPMCALSDFLVFFGVEVAAGMTVGAGSHLDFKVEYFIGVLADRWFVLHLLLFLLISLIFKS